MASHDLEHHARRVAELVTELEALPESSAKSKALELVENIDHLHRSCVWGLFEVLSELGGKGLIERMVSDPAVRMLFILYDLIPSEPLTPVESTSTVASPYSSGFIPLDAIGGVERKPAWNVAFAREDLPPGVLRAIQIEQSPVLIAATDDAVYAYRNTCPGSILPLHLGTLVDGEIHCPWHGCRYDVQTGIKAGAPDTRLEAFQVSLDGDRIRVATNVTSTPGGVTP